MTASPNVIEAARRLLEQRRADAATHYRAVPGIGSGPMGLTPDDVKARDDYRAARRQWEIAHETLRAFNAANPPPRRPRREI